MEEKDFTRGFSIDKLNQGDGRAFEALFHHFYKPLCFFSERLVGARDAAEDIVEEAFIKLWDRLDQFESVVHVRGFLYKAVKNACLDHLKVSARTGARELLFSCVSQQDEQGFYNEMIRSEVLGHIYRAIHDLPEQCARIITMSYVDGFKNAEISEKLGVSLQTVKNQKSRGLKLLQGQLAKYISFLVVLFLSCL